MTEFQSMPIVRLEIESMKQTLMIAINQYLLNLDEQIKQAVEEACKPEKVQALLDEATARYLKEKVDEAVKYYLYVGEGKARILANIKQELEAELGSGPDTKA
jgi:N12 class adenine-specific DNA methylase